MPDYQCITEVAVASSRSVAGINVPTLACDRINRHHLVRIYRIRFRHRIRLVIGAVAPHHRERQDRKPGKYDFFVNAAIHL